MAKTTDSSYKKIKSIKKGKEDKVGVVELAPEAVEQPTTETPTTTPAATTPVATDPAQAAVDAQDAKDRLWDSLTYSYDRKRQKSDEAYDKAFSQQDRHALSRGMQRSSYNAQTLANLQNQKVEAANDIESEKIADYENRLNEMERQEKADEQWERQFAEGQRQFEEQMAFSREQAQTSAEQFEKQLTQTQQSSDQQLAYQYALAMIQKGTMPSKDLLKRAGLSRKDAKKMIGDTGTTGGTSNTSGVPDWQKLKFKTREDWLKAKKLGIKTGAEYYAQGTTTPTDKTFLDGLNSGGISSVSGNPKSIGSQIKDKVEDTKKPKPRVK